MIKIYALLNKKIRMNLTLISLLKKRFLSNIKSFKTWLNLIFNKTLYFYCLNLKGQHFCLKKQQFNFK